MVFTSDAGLNAVGQNFDNYNRRADESFPGMCVDSTSVRDRETKYTNTGRTARQTVAPMTVGGAFANGDTITITLVGNSPTAGAFTENVVTTFDGTEADATAAAVKVADSINANDLANDLIFAIANGADVEITVRAFQEIGSIAGASTGGATITAAPAVTAVTNSPIIEFGTVVVRYPTYSEAACSAMDGAAGVIILGVAEWNRSNQTANYPFVNDANGVPLGFREAATVWIARKGKLWVPVAGAVEGTNAQIDPATGAIVANGTAGAVDFPLPGSVVFGSNSNALGHAKLYMNMT